MMNSKPTTTLKEDFDVLGLLSGDVAKSLNEEAEDAGSGDEEKVDADGDNDGDKDKAKKDKDKEDKLPNFLKKPAAPAADEAAVKAEQLEAAEEVVRVYFGCSEAEDKTLTNEELRTVIDALVFLVNESWDSAGGKPKEKLTDLPNGGDSEGFPAGEKPEPTAGPLAAKKLGTPYGERGRSGSGEKPYSARHVMGPVQSESLGQLVSDLQSIKQAVMESGPSSEQVVLSENIIAGLESIRDTSAEVANRITSDLAESKNVSEKDERHSATSYFASLAEDAAGQLALIAEGNLDIEDAVENLNQLAEELKKGLDLLKEVA